MDLGLDGRVALVTGASGDIGGAIARAFEEEGALVAAGFHANKVKTGFPVRVDLRDHHSPEAAVTEVAEALCPASVLVANAVAWPERAPADTWETLLDGLTANVVGTMALVEAVLPGMRARGWGRIVLISS